MGEAMTAEADGALAEGRTSSGGLLVDPRLVEVVASSGWADEERVRGFIRPCRVHTSY